MGCMICALCDTEGDEGRWIEHPGTGVLCDFCHDEDPDLECPEGCRELCEGCHGDRVTWVRDSRSSDGFVEVACDFCRAPDDGDAAYDRWVEEGR